MTVQATKQDKQIEAIVDVAEQVDLTRFEAWNDLDALSSRTQIDSIEVDPAGISIGRDKFSGVASVYVVLEYAGGGDDGFTTSDSFLGKFSGHFDQSKKPVVDQFTVDTSPFFSGEGDEFAAE